MKEALPIQECFVTISRLSLIGVVEAAKAGFRLPPPPTPPPPLPPLVQPIMPTKEIFDPGCPELTLSNLDT